MHPQISVVIPAYNTEDYIQEAVNSVLSQTLSDLEIIVVDDASTDRTVEILAAIADPRLKVVSHTHNQGAGAARNRALREATGEWIAVLDSDDWYAPERLERLLTFAQSQEADMVADDLYIIEDGQTQPRTTLVKHYDPTIDQAMVIDPTTFVRSDIEGHKGLALGFSKPLFRRQFLVENDIAYRPDIKVSQDFWLDMDCLVRGAKFCLLPEPYYYYRSRDGALSTSTDKIERLTQECSVIKQYLKDEAHYLSQDASLQEALRFKLRETQKVRDYYVVVGFVKQGKWREALIESLQKPLFYQKMISAVPQAIYRRLRAVLWEREIYNKFT